MLRGHLPETNAPPDQDESMKYTPELSPLPKWLAREGSDSKMAVKSKSEAMDCPDNNHHTDQHGHPRLHKVQSLDAGYKLRDSTKTHYSSSPSSSPSQRSFHKHLTNEIPQRVPSSWGSIDCHETRSHSECIRRTTTAAHQYQSLGINNVSGLQCGSIMHSDQFKRFSRHCNSGDVDDGTESDAQMDTSGNDGDTTSSAEIVDPWLDPTPIVNINQSQLVLRDVPFSSLPMHAPAAGSERITSQPPVVCSPWKHHERLWGDGEPTSLPVHDYNQNINYSHDSSLSTTPIAQNGLFLAHKHLVDDEPRSLPMTSPKRQGHREDDKPPLPERKPRKLERTLGTSHLWGHPPSQYRSHETTDVTRANPPSGMDESPTESRQTLSEENGQNDGKAESPAAQIPHCDTGNDPGGTTNPPEPVERYTKKRVNRAHSGRRCVSDLGFSHGADRVPTPRTAALLSNPSLRKHLSRVLKVDQENLDVKDFNWNFQLHMSLNQEKNGGRGDADSIQERLNMSAGCYDESMLAIDESKENVHVLNSSSNSSIKTSVSDSHLMCHKQGSNEHVHESSEKDEKSHQRVSLGVPPLDLRDLEGSTTPRCTSARMFEERKSARALKSLQLQIPSFEEFKLLRRSRTVPKHRSLSPFHRTENRIPEEVDNGDISPLLRSRSLQRHTYSGGDTDELNITWSYDESGESDTSFRGKPSHHMKPPLPPKPKNRDKSPANLHAGIPMKVDNKLEHTIMPMKDRNAGKSVLNIPPPLLPEETAPPVVPPRRRKKKSDSSLAEKVVPPLPIDNHVQKDEVHTSDQWQCNNVNPMIRPLEIERAKDPKELNTMISAPDVKLEENNACQNDPEENTSQGLDACIIAPPAQFSTNDESLCIADSMDSMMSKPPLPVKPVLPIKPQLPLKPKRFNPSTKPPIIAKPIIDVLKKTDSKEFDSFIEYVSEHNSHRINIHPSERSHSTKLQRREAFLRKRSNSEGDDSADTMNPHRPPRSYLTPPRLAQGGGSLSLSNSFDESVLNRLDINDTIEEARRRHSSGEKDMKRGQPVPPGHHVHPVELPVARESEEPATSDGNGSTSDLGAEEFLDDISPLSGDSMLLPSPDATTVSRSFSDVSDIKAEETRTRSSRERRTKPYKSDPFCARSHAESRIPQKQKTEDDLTDEQALMEQRRRKCSVTATREDILGFLLDVKQSGVVAYNDQDRLSQFSMDSYSDDEEYITQFGRASWRFSRSSSRRSSGFRSRKASGSGMEVERVDSGVGSEIKLDATIEYKGEHCEDCDETLSSEELNDGNYLCKRCSSRRRERKEALQEILTTEVSYGKDLTVIKQEFYIPMKTAGLLTPEQLQTIFCNIDELRSVNVKFSDQLRDTMQLAMEQGDEDYITVDVGQLFFAASNMMLAFEAYCVGRADAANLLGQLENEKELLRIFLHVSQTENSLLRRMGLKAFLMLPVQRVMKYPLLLSRLYKATPSTHPDKEMIRKAQQKVEEILDNINKKTKGSADTINMRIRQKFLGPKKSFHLTGPVTQQHLHKIAAGVLSWQEENTECILTGRLLSTQPTDHLWTKKVHTLKFTPVHMVLVVHHKIDILSGYNPNNKKANVAEAAVILLKEKGVKLTLLRDAFILSKCVVSVDPECDEVFEIMDFSKDAYLFKSELPNETLRWLSHLRHQMRGLGSWRQRRNALPNIMMHHTSCDV